MNVALVLVGDGRTEYLERAVESLREQVDYPFVSRIMVDDSGDRAHRKYLKAAYPEFVHVHHTRRKGTVEAVRSGWRSALLSGVEYVFHTEEDFTFNEPVQIDAMAALLEAHPNFAQVILKRDPYSWPEHEAGGFMELAPDKYHERTSELGVWCEHERLFSSNPSLIPRKVFSNRFCGEAEFGKFCVRQGWCFAYWGAKADPPRVTHIGLERSQGWKA